jgi:hypothetical protein
MLMRLSEKNLALHAMIPSSVLALTFNTHILLIDSLLHNHLYPGYRQQWSYYNEFLISTYINSNSVSIGYHLHAPLHNADL